MINLYWIFPLFFTSLSISSAQNVGIGTSTPTEKLEVEGNILTDTVKLNAILLPPNAWAGKILTSDGNGNAAWQELNIPPSPNEPEDNIGYGVWGDCGTNGNIAGYQPIADTAFAYYKNFGYSLSISGNNAAIGAYKDNIGSGQGSVSMYVFNGTSWDLIQKLTDPEGGSYDAFGTSICIR